MISLALALVVVCRWSLFVVFCWSLFVVCFYLLFVVVCRLLLFVVVCHLSLFVIVCRGLSFVVVCCLLLFVISHLWLASEGHQTEVEQFRLSFLFPFLSDPSPIIGYACHSLTDSLTNSLTAV